MKRTWHWCGLTALAIVVAPVSAQTPNACKHLPAKMTKEVARRLANFHKSAESALKTWDFLNQYWLEGCQHAARKGGINVFAAPGWGGIASQMENSYALDYVGTCRRNVGYPGGYQSETSHEACRHYLTLQQKAWWKHDEHKDQIKRELLKHVEKPTPKEKRTIRVESCASKVARFYADGSLTHRLGYANLFRTLSEGEICRRLANQ